MVEEENVDEILTTPHRTESFSLARVAYLTWCELEHANNTLCLILCSYTSLDLRIIVTLYPRLYQMGPVAR